MMSSQYVKVVIFLITGIVASTFFLLLHFVDNKYTAPGAQPEKGILQITENDWEQDPFRFLRDGWMFYDGDLLTPETIAQAQAPAYITIGTQTSFNQPGPDPHGSGTYALKLRLPARDHAYSIELPEVYSAYRFYVNDNLIVQEGNPSPAHYKPQTQIKKVVFTASGETTLILAVSDYSHFYSGLVYPPAFGEPAAVDAFSNTRLVIQMAVMMVILITSILCISLSVRMRHPNTLLFAFTCLAAIIYTSYSIVHSLGAPPMRFWYVFELSTGYLFVFLIVLLHGRICKLSPLTTLAANIIAAAFCMVAVAYSCYAPYLTVQMIQVFSSGVTVYKIAVAVFLLLTAWSALKREAAPVEMLLIGDLIYAIACFWDRILPSYEPIYGGWFMEWGILAIVCAFAIVMWRDLSYSYATNLAFTEEHRHIKRQLSMQTELFQQLSSRVEESRHLRHDMRHHFRTIMNMVQTDQKDQLIQYIGTVAALNDSPMPISFCYNVPVNSLLYYYHTVAEKNSIKMTAHIDLPETLEISDVDMCSIMGNLTENAIEACLRQTVGQRFIKIWVQCDKHTLLMALDNSYDGKISYRRGHFYSQKHPGHGIGLESVKKLVSLYGGIVEIKHGDQLFQVELSLPIKKQS